MTDESKRPPQPYTYEMGAEPIAACGAWKPFGPRILARAILENDWHALRVQNKAAALRAESERVRLTGDGITAAQLLAQADAMVRDALVVPIFSAMDVVAFEIVAIGAGVAQWCEKNSETPPTVGQHCDARSIAADRIGDKQTGRYWAIHVEDLIGSWDAPTEATEGLIDAINAHVLRKQDQAAAPPSNGHGAVDLSPAQPQG